MIERPDCPICGSHRVRKESPVAFVGILITLCSLIAAAVGLGSMVFSAMIGIGLTLVIVGFAVRYGWACADRFCRYRWTGARARVYH